MLDSTQRADALDINSSFIVQAPAGSGKTELLTNRYLSLLAVATKPENILALTFTNKAVSELRARIMHSLLNAYHNNVPEPDHKRKNFELAQAVLARSEQLDWHILLDHSRMRITTFDGLAYGIAQHNMTKGDVRALSLLENADDYYEQAVAQVLQQADTHEVRESIIYVIRHFDYEYTTIVRLFAQMLKEREKWLTKLYDSAVNTTTIATNIQKLVTIELQRLRLLASKNLTTEFFDLAVINTHITITKQPKSLKEFKDIATLCLTKSNTLRKTLAKKDGFDNTTVAKSKAFRSYIAGFSTEFIAALAQVRYLPEDTDTTLIEHIAKILLALHHQLQELFDTERKVDYTEIALRANEALHEANITDVALALDAHIEHILIDEFQDTSITQCTLIERIVAHWQVGDGRTLFLVGDPMQSIYLFRGAEVGLFLSISERGLQHIILKNIVLEHNFRSLPGIVEHTNTICAGAFPKMSNINVGQVAYSYAKSVHTQRAVVEMQPFLAGEEVLELEYIADIISRTKEQHPEYSIGILCRTATEFTTISHYLHNRGISITAYKNMKLSHHSLVKDILLLCRILFDRYDKLAWLSLLRSPYVGLELEQLLYFADTIDIFESIPEVVARYENLQRLQHLYEVMTYAYTHLGTLGVTNIIHTIVFHLALQHTFNQERQAVYALFSTTLHTLELSNTLTIASLESALQEEYTPSAPSDVTLLTIHKAKGLEFDVVILPMLNQATRSDTDKLLYLTEFIDIGVLLAAKSETKIYNYLKHNYKQRASNELLRLLYVALTRAKYELYMSACLDMTSKTPVKSNTLMHILSEKYLHLWHDKTHNATHTESTSLQHYKYILPASKPLVAITQFEHITSLAIQNHIFAALGNIVHICLEREDFNPSDTVLSALCERFALPITARVEHVQQLQHILSVIRNSAHFEFIFTPRESTCTEQLLVYQEHTYIIDRVFEVQGTIYIIDFKTVFSQTLTSEQQQIYTKQLYNYAQAVKSIYNKTDEPITIKTALFITTTGDLIYV